MYATLLTLHSFVRWLVLFFLVLSICRAFTGYRGNRPFSGTDNRVRHWTATVTHIQLMLGIILYTQSPLVSYFWAYKKTAGQHMEFSFYALVHMILMLTAITILTIGSALAKRKTSHKEKFRTVLVTFSVALLLILIAIPWPFSPLSGRPLFRPF